MGERHIVFRRGSTLLAQEMSYAPLELRGTPVPLARDVYVADARATFASVQASASVVIYRRDEQPALQFTWFARDGRRLNTFGPGGHYLTFSLADNATRAIASRRDAGVHNLWSIDVAKGTINRVTAGNASDMDPRVSPDGRHVVFASTRDPQRSPFRTSIAGEKPTRLFPFKGNMFALDDWSADGRWLLFRNVGAPCCRPCRSIGWTMSRSSSRGPRGNHRPATMSPDGRWVTYNSSESGRHEVYVVSFPPTGDKWQVSTSGGAQPQWRADSGELYFLTLDGALSAATINTLDGFRASEPVELFQAPLRGVNTEMEQYAPSPDGKHRHIDDGGGVDELDAAGGSALSQVPVVRHQQPATPLRGREPPCGTSTAPPVTNRRGNA